MASKRKCDDFIFNVQIAISLTNQNHSNGYWPCRPMSYKQNHLANAIKTKKIKVREKERGRMKWKKMRNSIDETRV